MPRRTYVSDVNCSLVLLACRQPQQQMMISHSPHHCAQRLASSQLSRDLSHHPAVRRVHARRSGARAPDIQCTAQQNRAVVVGGGMGGLATAKVLSKHFDNVIVIEKDAIEPSWADKAAAETAQIKGARRGVTQYHHLHVLVGGGLRALDRIFEGRFTPAMKQAGAVLSDVATSFYTYHPLSGRWAQPQAAKGPLLIAQATRHLVESVTRQLLEGTQGVQVLYGTTATGLVMQQEEGQPEGSHPAAEGGGRSHKRVTGVVLSDGSEVAADLVVDCLGRQSVMADWLAAAGVPKPRVSEVDANLGYASWLVKLDPQTSARTLNGMSGIYAMTAYPETIGTLVVEVEGGLHMAAVCTYAGQAPPFKDAELVDFMARNAWHPAAVDTLLGSTPMSPASRFYRVSSNWRHYEEVPLPEGLIITADAVCSFNPIYGQGMSVAAMEAAKLDELLSGLPAGQEGWLNGFSHAYQLAITPIIQQVWDLSVAGDLRFSSTTSTEPPSPLSGLKNGYFDVIMALAGYDPEVTEALLRVMHLLDDLSVLTTPRMVGKVLMHQLKAPFTGLWQQGLQSPPTEPAEKLAATAAVEAPSGTS